MIVFRSRQEEADPKKLIDALLHRVVSAPSPDHGEVVEWLIECGVLESAIADALHPERDGEDGVCHLARQASLHTGSAFVASWKDGDPGAHRARLERCLRKLARKPLPPRVVTRVPEGYAFYGLYPEPYAAAAETFHRDKKPVHVVVIGLRSIGTSLSAVVAASLERKGCRVVSFTVRPRGEPWDRHLVFDAEVQSLIASRDRAWFAIVDEGPGLSGTSMTGVAEALSDAGVPDNRIVFFPSWLPEPSAFLSPRAASRWPRHLAYTGSFEQEWVDSGRLARALGMDKLEDVSAGRWRPLLYRDGRPAPAVHPQHERRRFLGTRGGTPILARFVGLGKCGRAKLERAKLLAKAGFAPEVHDYAHGFLTMDFVEGRPASAPPAPKYLLDTMSRYLAFLHREFRVERGTPFEQITAMARTNVAEALGDSWCSRLRALEKLDGAFDPVALDGRITPQEWILAEDGWRKMDATDHHDDHFYPGCSDIAWDIAATCEEFSLGRAAEDELVQRVAALTKEKRLSTRIAPFRVAYLAYRLGYAQLAGRSLGPPDGPGWQVLAAKYRARLREALECLPSR